MLRFMGSQRVRHDWATELNWKLQNDPWLFSPTLSLKHSKSNHILPPSLLPPWSKLVWAITVSCWDCFNSLLNGLLVSIPIVYYQESKWSSQIEVRLPQASAWKPLKACCFTQEETKSLRWLKKPWLSTTSSVTLSPLTLPQLTPLPPWRPHCSSYRAHPYLRACGLLSFLEMFLQNQWLQSSRLHLCYISTQMLSTTHKAFLTTLFKMHTPPLIPELPISFSYSPQQHLPYFICLSTSKKQ